MKPWSKDEDDVVRALYTEDCDLSSIAGKVRRSIAAIAHRLVVLGLAERQGHTIVRKTNVKDTLLTSSGTPRV